MPDIAADYYFIGNIDDEYAWGTGVDYEDLMNDAIQAFENYRDIDIGVGEWEDELENLEIYPTDEYTYNYIRNEGGIGEFIKKGDLYVIDQ